MAGARSVNVDGSTLSRMDRGLYRIETVFAIVAGLTVLGMMFMAVFSVLGRNFFNAPLPGYVDWIEQAMPLIAFMGLSYTQRDGGHIRMDILIGRLKGRPLWIAELLTTIAAAILIGLLVWGSWAHFSRSFDFAAPYWSRDSSIDIAIPLWPAKLLVPVSFSVLLLRLLIQCTSYLQAIVTGNNDPVAVPLIKSVAEQAAEEAALMQSNEG